MTAETDQIANWLEVFTKCVQQQDYDAGRKLFLSDIVCFGSHADILIGIDELVERQWKKIWPHITGFQYELDRLVCKFSDDFSAACAVVPWVSTGYFESGAAYDRPGRVSIFFVRPPAQRGWLASHTHHSLNPGIPQHSIRSG